MIALSHMAGRRVAVMGLGGSGVVTAHALTAGGAEVVCYDDRREPVEAAWDAGLPTGDLRVADFAAFDALVLAPGIPLTHPGPHWSVARARAADVPIVGDLELFDRERRARVPELRLAAITGTNGKSTTTALLGHLLRELGEAAQVGGNIGRPALDLDPVAGVAVVECSSYQIDLAPSLTPEAGALINLSPDHIDRHGTFANYAAVKERLVAASRQATIGIGDAVSAGIADRLEAAGKPVRRIGAFDAHDEATALDAVRGNGVVAIGGTLVEVANGVARAIADLAAARALCGRHNAENAAASVALAVALGHDAAAAASHLATFGGLAHRMELVAERAGVAFVNDSKATNAQSARQALASYPRVHWIAGGVAKEGGIAGLTDLFPRVAHAYLIGAAAEDFAATLADVPHTVAGTLEVALDAAAERARGGETVLLSPACASFDQFANFEARGEHFRSLVRRLTEAAA